MENTILKIKNISKHFSDGATKENIIENLSLDIEKNEFVSILGTSGCGKTTLLRCIAGFEEYEGEIFVDGNLVHNAGTDRIVVFQDFNQLFPWKTVEKNIQYPLKLKGIKDKKELDEITKEYLRKVNLPGIEKKYPHQLSGGMKQRIVHFYS